MKTWEIVKGIAVLINRLIMEGTNMQKGIVISNFITGEKSYRKHLPEDLSLRSR